MAFGRWLRANAEHYLMIAAQDRVARTYGANRPRPPHGVREIFWLRIFAPVYGLIPWSVRRAVIHLMPGSHRRSWPAPPKPSSPAV